MPPNVERGVTSRGVRSDPCCRKVEGPAPPTRPGFGARVARCGERSSTAERQAFDGFRVVLTPKQLARPVAGARTGRVAHGGSTADQNGPHRTIVGSTDGLR